MSLLQTQRFGKCTFQSNKWPMGMQLHGWGIPIYGSGKCTFSSQKGLYGMQLHVVGEFYFIDLESVLFHLISVCTACSYIVGKY